MLIDEDENEMRFILGREKKGIGVERRGRRESQVERRLKSTEVHSLRPNQILLREELKRRFLDFQSIQTVFYTVSSISNVAKAMAC